MIESLGFKNPFLLKCSTIKKDIICNGGYFTFYNSICAGGAVSAYIVKRIQCNIIGVLAAFYHIQSRVWFLK